MPTKDELEKIAAEQAAADVEKTNRKKEAEKKEQEELEENSRQAVSIEPLIDENKEEAPFEESEFKAQVAGHDVSPLIEDYKKKFNKTPTLKPDGSYVLYFESDEKARLFFEEQASMNRKFISTEEGKGVDGLNFFSCGDRKLYQGTILSIMDELQRTFMADSNNYWAKEGWKYLRSNFPSIQPSQVYRETVQGLNPEEGKKSSSPNVR